MRDINTDFRHYLHGAGVQPDWMRAGAECLESIAHQMPQPSLPKQSYRGCDGQFQKLLAPIMAPEAAIA